MPGSVRLIVASLSIPPNATIIIGRAPPLQLSFGTTTGTIASVVYNLGVPALALPIAGRLPPKLDVCWL